MHNVRTSMYELCISGIHMPSLINSASAIAELSRIDLAQFGGWRTGKNRGRVASNSNKNGTATNFSPPKITLHIRTNLRSVVASLMLDISWIFMGHSAIGSFPKPNWLKKPCFTSKDLNRICLNISHRTLILRHHHLLAKVESIFVHSLFANLKVSTLVRYSLKKESIKVFGTFLWYGFFFFAPSAGKI